MKTFLEECNRVLSTKLLNAEQSDTENQTKLDYVSSELDKIEETRKTVSKNAFDKEVFVPKLEHLFQFL